MRNLFVHIASLLCLAVLPSAFAADARDNAPVIPCDQPGANPGGARATDATTAPCNVGTPQEIGNTSVTKPPPGGERRLPPASQTRKLPPPHNPQPHPSETDR